MCDQIKGWLIRNLINEGIHQPNSQNLGLKKKVNNSNSPPLTFAFKYIFFDIFSFSLLLLN
jgi:hypothetical protein